MKRLFLLVFMFSWVTPLFAGEPWAPISGYSSVNQTRAYNKFVFGPLIGGQYADNETYEHETQVYNNHFADYDGYSRSNMPEWYYDTPFLDGIDNFTVGSAKATDLKVGVTYWTTMALRKGNNSDCQGCCSKHGGVVCEGGASFCADGTPLSKICASKGCNQCFNYSTVRIKGQRGHSVIPGCTSTWCIFPDATTGTMCLLNAPQYKSWAY